MDIGKALSFGQNPSAAEWASVLPICSSIVERTNVFGWIYFGLTNCEKLMVLASKLGDIQSALLLSGSVCMIHPTL